MAKALQHNLDLAVQRQSVALSKAPEQGANVAFEPALFADVSLSRSPGQISRQRAGLTPMSSTNVGGTVGLKKTFSTGTSVEASLSSRPASVPATLLDPVPRSPPQRSPQSRRPVLSRPLGVLCSMAWMLLG